MPPCVLRVEGEGGGATELTAEFCPDGSASVVLLFSGDHVEVRAQTPSPNPYLSLCAAVGGPSAVTAIPVGSVLGMCR
jgi:hypothetical protein